MNLYVIQSLVMKKYPTVQSANSLTMSRKRSIGQMNEFVLEAKKVGRQLKKKRERQNVNRQF